MFSTSWSFLPMNAACWAARRRLLLNKVHIILSTKKGRYILRTPTQYGAKSKSNIYKEKVVFLSWYQMPNDDCKNKSVASNCSAKLAARRGPTPLKNVILRPLKRNYRRNRVKIGWNHKKDVLGYFTHDFLATLRKKEWKLRKFSSWELKLAQNVH